MKPALAAKKNCNGTFNLDSSVKGSKIMEHDAPIVKKKNDKKWLKIARVKALKQTQQARKILRALNTSQLLKPITVWMKPNK